MLKDPQLLQEIVSNKEGLVLVYKDALSTGQLVEEISKDARIKKTLCIFFNGIKHAAYCLATPPAKRGAAVVPAAEVKPQGIIAKAAEKIADAVKGEDKKEDAKDAKK